MKTKSVFLTIAAVLAFVSTGQTNNNTGTIIVYSPCSLIGAGINNWRFNLNHGSDLIVRNGTYCRLTVLAGNNIISHDNMTLREEDPHTVHVYPGQTVYFKYNDNIFLTFQVADDQEEAPRTVSRLTPMEEQFDDDSGD
jgi:hypothetical protein